jgi:AraC-like DNA-binding protein
MKYLGTANFFGRTNQTVRLEGITLTDTEYTHEYVDWHYHENAYFTFILQGFFVEGNRKEIYNCPAGSLLFHNWHESHYNIKPAGFTRGFHIELHHELFDELDFDIGDLQGSFKIENTDAKLLAYKIFVETKLNDDVSAISIQDFLLKILGKLLLLEKDSRTRKPQWVKRLREILHDDYSGKLSLNALGKELSVHPVHLSRDFSKYFYCNLGEYIRKIRVEKSLSLMADRNLTLTQIAFECGFADQSHFARCFKNIRGIKPSEYRKLF